MVGGLTQEALWLIRKTVSDKLHAHLLSQGIDGILANNTAVINVLQDHGTLHPRPEGKLIWKATITSETSWSHCFTLLRLVPALFWEANERPEPFTGTVTVETPNATEIGTIEDASDVEASVGAAPPSSPATPSEQDYESALRNEIDPDTIEGADG